MKNEKNKLKKTVECPKCLGVGYIYISEENKDTVCRLCEGLGEVYELDADSFDPLHVKEAENIENENEEFDY